MSVKYTVASCLLNMSVGFWLCLLIIKLYSQKHIKKNEYIKVDMPFIKVEN